MKLNCPCCTAVLELSESLAKKLVSCPKCQQNFVVPEAPQPVTAPRKAPQLSSAPDTYEMNEEPVDENVPKPQDPDELKFCPGCGIPWRKGAKECKKCHYVAALGAQLRPKDKKRLNLKIDTQKFYLVLFGVGAIVGLYFLVTKWHVIKGYVNSFLG